MHYVIEVVNPDGQRKPLFTSADLERAEKLAASLRRLAPRPVEVRPVEGNPESRD